MGWNKLNHQALIKEYQDDITCTCTSLAQKYHTSIPAICFVFKKYKIKLHYDAASFSRKYTLNENYFDKIDSEDKAYFLGLLYADGCNSENIKSVKISLQENDKDILLKFNEYLQSNKPLGFYKSKNIKHKNQQVLEINSKRISQKLVKLGCVARKSLILTFPTTKQVPRYLLPHFVRGYFDGDGGLCMYFDKRDNGLKFMTTITSTEQFCQELQKLFQKKIKINSFLNKRWLNKGNDITTTISISGNQQNLKFLNWLYKDATVYLNRKYNKYIEFKNEMQKRGLINEGDML